MNAALGFLFAVFLAICAPLSGTAKSRRRAGAEADERRVLAALWLISRYFRPSDARISALVASRSGFSEWTDRIRSGSSFNRSMLSRNTIVPTTGGFGTGPLAAVGRLNM